MFTLPTRVGWIGAACLVVGALQPWSLVAQTPRSAANAQLPTVSQEDMRTWLTYLSSDALEGRRVFTEGYGLAAAYIAEQLGAVGARPLGDAGYFQTVKRVGYRVTQNSTVNVTVNGQTRVFKHGEHVTFPLASGGPQTLAFDAVEFAGYGLVDLSAGHDDFKDRDVRNKLVVWMPGTPGAQSGGGRGRSRSPFIVQTFGAGAVLTFAPAPPPPSPDVLAAEAGVEQANLALTQAEVRLREARAAASGRGGRGGRGFGRGGRGAGAAVEPNLTTVQRVDLPVTPQLTADETFFDLLFSGTPGGFAAIRARAEAGEPLAPMALPGVQVTVTVDNAYEVVSTELTKNVVAMVEGSDPVLKDTFVMLGAHLDHSGYRETPPAGGTRCRTPEPGDTIFNGADDDGSGSTGLLGIAKALATGPKPKRSVLFVWHTAEESGLLGSRYMADHPVVPLDRIEAQLNIDMIGRSRDDDPAMGNTVFVIGADRISTDLHNLVEETNSGLEQPMSLDYEYNDPSDSNSFYTRSDHYSYAAKGIPIAFFFTGTHQDYHCVTDEVQYIDFPKLTRVTQLVYQAAFEVADRPEPLERDNLGPRAGVGHKGKISK